jgi:hypothetical protein
VRRSRGQPDPAPQLFAGPVAPAEPARPARPGLPGLPGPACPACPARPARPARPGLPGLPSPPGLPSRLGRIDRLAVEAEDRTIHEREAERRRVVPFLVPSPAHATTLDATKDSLG